MKKILFYLTLFSSLINFTFSQSGWFQIYSISGVGIHSDFFADVNTGYVAGIKLGNRPVVYKTTNSGINWVDQITPQSDSANFYFRSIFFTDANTGFIAAANLSTFNIGRILKTTDGGSTWNNTPLPVDKHMTTLFFINQNTGYASGRESMLKTTNAGATWTLILNYSYYLFGIHFTDVNTGYVVGNLGVIFKTTNGGGNWIQLNSGTNQMLWGLSFADANTGVAVGGDANNNQNIILRTTDSGNNWSAIPYTYSTCLLWSVKFINPATGWIAGWCGQIIKTTNGGLNWYNQEAPVNDYRFCTFLNANTGFAVGTSNGVILKTTDGGGNFVGIKSISNEVPSGFNVFQNYPNPFNPTTKIRFSLPTPSEGGAQEIKLVIYDPLGREVAALVNEQLKPGTYEVEWNASKYSSGVFYFTLSAGNYKETKKMILLK